ncbi:MAG TPA: DNA-binding protein [Verrucomicrobiales bacterium]|nr:DNA-binding protein [Verrucomicrobiales bacterium]
MNRLKNLELTAREQQLGLWNEKVFSRTGTPKVTVAADPRTDLNEASFEELQKLPGIGPVLAERIIARRPFTTIDELEKVKGIGAKTMERLRPLVRVEGTSDEE